MRSSSIRAISRARRSARTRMGCCRRPSSTWRTLDPAPKTVALVGADAEYSNNVLTGARLNAKKLGLRIVYDRTYPPSTVDYSPIVRAIQATSPDIVLVASYPP